MLCVVMFLIVPIILWFLYFYLMYKSGSMAAKGMYDIQVATAKQAAKEIEAEKNSKQ
jgi:hypothetical protein